MYLKDEVVGLGPARRKAVLADDHVTLALPKRKVPSTVDSL